MTALALVALAGLPLADAHDHAERVTAVQFAARSARS